MMPGISRNCLRTSSTTCAAARPTARIVSELNRNAIVPPASSPTSTSGWSMRMPSNVKPASFKATSNEPNNDVAAITADAIAMPLVIALVELPTASSRRGSRPAALELAGHLGDALGVVGDRAVGVHRDDDTDRREHAHARQRDDVEALREQVRRSGSASRKATMIVPATTSAAHTDDSRPTEKPVRIVVAVPVTWSRRPPCTGPYFVSVKYSVSF